MHCLISVVLDSWSAIHREAQRNKRELLAAASAIGAPRPPVFRAARGMLLIVDWDRERVLAARELPKPTGLLLDGERLWVALWDHDEVATLEGGRVTRRIRHPWFNHIHTLDRTARGLLLSSSGSDLLAEVDERGELLWSYFMFEHGYGRFRLGRSFDRARDYNGRYLPAALSSHPNSALVVDERTVLATLFSTGELVRIDRQSGALEVVLDGLARPHSIRRRPGGYLLSDTEGGRVLLLDDKLAVEATIPVDAGWIQDANLYDDRLFVVGNRRIMSRPLDPAESGRDSGPEVSNYVIELRNARARKRLDLGPERRIYMVEPIPESSAERLAAADERSREPALDWLRWEAYA
jgi:hypothetical protein